MMLENQTQEPGGLTSSEPFAPAHWLAQLVVILFAIFIGVALFSIVSDLLQLELLADAISGGEVSQERAESNDARQTFVGLLHLGVRLLLAVAFLFWLHRVTRNVPALGNPKMKIDYTPGWAVGSFFIPFGNLFMPYRAVREVWAKSDPAARTEADVRFGGLPTPPLVLGWWVLFLAGNFIARATDSMASGTDTAQELRVMTWVTIAADVVAIAAAVLGMLVVRDINRRQAERARHVAYVPHTPPPPPLFTQPPPATQG